MHLLVNYSLCTPQFYFQIPIVLGVQPGRTIH